MYKQGNIMDVIEEGERLKLTGMQRAVDHADNVSPNWSARAYEAGRRFISSCEVGTKFLTEELREWTYSNCGLDSPPSDRAWGAVTIMLRKSGFIVSDGFAQVSNPKAHRTPATLWRIISKP